MSVMQPFQLATDSAQPAGPVVTSLARRITALSQESSRNGEQARTIRWDLILVADEDPVGLASMRKALERSGYQVAAAENGDQVLEVLERCAPGLVLLDLDLPGMSSLEVCRRLKADPRHADIPVIFATVTSDPQVRASGFAAGGVDCVSKPVGQVELLARIKCHIELAASRRALESRAGLYQAVATEQRTRLEQVRSGQTSLLTAPSAFSDLKLAVRFVTAHEAGGDFYEIRRFSEDQFGVLVTDVAGHDLSVPFITGALKGLAGLCLNECLSPRETMIMLNSGLRGVLSEEHFVTGCYAKIDRDSMELEVISAGHPAALIQRNDGRCEYVQSIGDVLGTYEQVLFESSRVAVETGDRLFLYTDGLIEGYRDEAGRQGSSLKGMRRLSRRVEELRSLPITGAVEAIVDQLTEESGESVADDVVLLGIEF